MGILTFGLALKQTTRHVLAAKSKIVNSVERRNLKAIKTYKDGTPFTGVIGRTTDESSPAWPEPPRPPEGAPNVLIWVLLPTAKRLGARGNTPAAVQATESSA